VLDLSRLLPGPFLTMVLADLGADVVKIEDPHAGDYLRLMPPLKPGGCGGSMSGRYLAINRNKRSAILDLKKPPGREALLHMCERADVVVESFRPGVLDRLGVGPAALRARNPGLIVCSVSGYGQDGAYRERAGHDLNYVALAGVLAMGGMAGGAPLLPGVQIADLAGGALWGLVALLAALFARQRGAGGAHLDVSMTEGALALLAAELGSWDCGERPTRGREMLNGGLACYAVYRTADERYLAVGALEPKFWLAFNRAIGRRADAGELVAPGEVQQRIRAEVQAILATRTRDEWMSVLAGVDCCCEPVVELEELAEHPLHTSRQVFSHVEDPVLGRTLQVRTPVGMAAGVRRAPRHGEHTQEVLAEYGLSAEQIRSLSGAG
jgi:crotonobetainyl-CoA:carnitine CoA-transferase CaiB-like acyl-CoA transferase